MIRAKRLFLLSAIFAGVTAFAQMPGPHPRLLMREGAEPRADAGGVVAKADSIIVVFSDEVLDEPPVTRTMVGRRLLHTSREALKRVFWLGYTYRVHGGEAYARRAIDEMLAVSAQSACQNIERCAAASWPTARTSPRRRSRRRAFRGGFRMMT